MPSPCYSRGMHDLLTQIVDAVPLSSRELLSRLLQDSLRDPADLLAEIDAYVGFVQAFAETHPKVDAAGAGRLAERCRALIAATPAGPTDHQRLVQAACLYLVAIEGDLDEADGFADDEAVIAAVEAAIAR